VNLHLVETGVHVTTLEEHLNACVRLDTKAYIVKVSFSCNPTSHVYFRLCLHEDECLTEIFHFVSYMPMIVVFKINMHCIDFIEKKYR